MLLLVAREGVEVESAVPLFVRRLSMSWLMPLFPNRGTPMPDHRCAEQTPAGVLREAL